MTEQTKNEQMIKESRILQELQERMLKGIQAIENDHVMARGYEQYNEGWDHALARVRALLKGVVNDLMKVAAEGVTVVNPYTEKPEHDPINHPSHYTDGGIETLDYILAKKLDFLTGQVCKYISRAGKKNPEKELEDLKKAQFYLNRKVREMEEEKKEDSR